ncbi:MAG: hypothetical protein ACK5M4_13750 [Pseudorhodobacter sp.]
MAEKHSVKFTIYPKGAEAFAVWLSGREQWALEQLINAGDRGCTPILQPAPRWSAYVHKLRKQGVPIETLHEPHKGSFPGHHGRYILKAYACREDAA